MLFCTLFVADSDPASIPKKKHNLGGSKRRKPHHALLDHNHCTARRRMHAPWLLVIAASLCSAANITHPQLDLSAVGGSLGLFGSFSAISLYTSTNASQALTGTNSNQPGSSNLYLHDADSNRVTQLGQANGGLSSIDQLADGTVLINGNFSHFTSSSSASNSKRADSSEAIPPIIYNLTSGATTNIFQSLNGSVLTTLVDNELVYLGGDFQYNSTYGVAIYNTTAQLLRSTVFEGFGADSAVNTIVKILDDDDLGSIVFGGHFNTLGLEQLLTHNITTGFTNHSSINNHSNSTNTSLITAEQIISLKEGQFTSVNGDAASPLNTLICPETSQEWSVAPNEGGEWLVELLAEMKGITPTKVRLYLPQGEDSVKLFRIYLYPNNGIMNLSYVDPETNTLKFCDAWCPLSTLTQLANATKSNIKTFGESDLDEGLFVDSNGALSTYYDSSTKTKTLGYAPDYQEFSFEDQVGIDQIGITIIDWYGSQGKLKGFELFTNSIAVYGNNTLNEPNCASVDDTSNYSQTKGGDWKSVFDYTTALMDRATTNYLVTTVSGDNEVSVNFYPNISYSGDYQLLLKTPGCIPDASCDLRSIVNVTVYDIEDEVLSTQLIYQNNDYDKFDYLYQGHMNGSATSDGLQNRVEVLYDRPVIAGTNEPWFVVDKLTANIISLDEYYGTNTTMKNNHTNSTRSMRRSNVSTVSLNGLFEFSLANFTNFDPRLAKNDTNTFVGNSSINYLSGKLDKDANVTEILRYGDSLIVSGDFEVRDVSASNVTNGSIYLTVGEYDQKRNETTITTPVKRADTHSITLLGLELDNPATKQVTLDLSLILIGDFTAKLAAGGSLKQLGTDKSQDEIYNIAVYTDKEWRGLGNGEFGTNFDQLVNITLQDTEYYIFGSLALSEYNQVWDNSNFEWVTNSLQYNLKDINVAVYVKGQQILGSSSTFNIMDIYSIDQAYMNSSSSKSITAFDFNVSSMTNTTSYIGDSLYLNESLSVLSGRFNTTKGLNNVVFLTNGSARSLTGDVNWNTSVVQSLYGGLDSDYLVLGTNGSILIDGESNSAGIVIYDLSNDTFSGLKPAELTAAEKTLEVNALALHDADNRLLVGGNFDNAGSLGCPGVCVYDIANTRWIQPSNNDTIGPGSNIKDVKFFAQDKILIAGNITFAGVEQQQAFVYYDFDSQAFSQVLPAMNNLTTDIEKFIVVDNNGKLSGRMLAYGTGFVSGFDGSTWAGIDDAIVYSDETYFGDFKLLKLSSPKAGNKGKYFNLNQVLMLVGSFELDHYGLVNAALYNGTLWIPYAYTAPLKNNGTNGGLGVLNSILIKDVHGFQSSEELKNSKKEMSRGKVVGISLACAIGSTAFLSLLYLIPYFALFRRSKNDGATDQRIHESDMMGAVNPEDLIHEMDMQKR